jgi:protein SCO1
MDATVPPNPPTPPFEVPAPESPRKPGGFAPIMIGFALMVLLVIVIQRRRAGESREDAAREAATAKVEGFGDVLADWAPVPEFALIDRHSKPYGHEAMAGTVCVVNFFFTTCPGPCLDLTRKMRSVMQLFRGDPRVQLVSISVDPESDTPEQLASYVRVHGGDFSTWRWLTGSKEEVKKACAGFFAPFGEKDKAGDITHSTKLYVVDANGRIRSMIDSQRDPQWLERTSHDVRLLIEQTLEQPLPEESR